MCFSSIVAADVLLVDGDNAKCSSLSGLLARGALNVTTGSPSGGLTAHLPRDIQHSTRICHGQEMSLAEINAMRPRKLNSSDIPP